MIGKPDQCVSVIGSEHTLAFQFLATTSLNPNPNSRSNSNGNSKLHVKSGFAVHRLLWCDLLALLLCQSLVHEDLTLRHSAACSWLHRSDAQHLCKL